MTIHQLHTKYIIETKKHPINADSEDGSFADDYVIWLQDLVLNNDVLDIVSNTMINTRCTKCNHVFELKYSDDCSQLDTLKIGVGRDSDIYHVEVECPKCENNETVY